MSRTACLRLVLVLLLCGLGIPLGAQDATPPAASIPDLIGLTPAQAAARLNADGFALAALEYMEYTTLTSGTPNTIIAQSPAAGTSAEAGAGVRVTVQQAYNTRLVWDANDFTLVWDGTGGSADFLWLPGLRFAAVDEGSQAAFAGAWSDTTINPGFCAQLWTEAVRGAKDVPGCASARSTLWLTTIDPAAHFWTRGATAFEVYQDGVYRARCEVALFACTLYLAPLHFAPDVTEYAYFVYSAEALMLINQSPDHWMPASQITLDGRALGDPALFNPPPQIGRVDMLAPGQCLLFAASSSAVPLQPCAVIARATGAAFWTQGFTLVGRRDNTAQTCPPVVTGETMICLLPR